MTASAPTGGTPAGPPWMQRLAASAEERLGPAASAWLAAVADEGRSARRERASLDTITLRSRALVDPTSLSTDLELLGNRLATPVLAAPTTLQGIADAEGEVATVHGCHDAGSLAVVSCGATRTPEELAATGAPWWFQLYPLVDEAVTAEVIARAVAAGATAVVVTVDVPVPGRRTGDRVEAPMWLRAELAGRGGSEDVTPFRPLTWAALPRLRADCPVPLLAKGVLDAEDAARLAGQGVDGVIVSTHGARQFDAGPTAAEVLPAVREAAPSLAVLADGSVRSGTDVLRLLVRGADAVLLGRPTVWALAVEGRRGVARLFASVTEELRHAMAHTGVAGLDEVDGRLEWLPGAPPVPGRGSDAVGHGG